MIIERRGFIRGALSLIAAPAIVRVTSIMPVKAMPLGLGWDRLGDILFVGTLSASTIYEIYMRSNANGDPIMEFAPIVGDYSALSFHHR